MGFIVSGSSDYFAGQPFAFVSALDTVGPWPPVAESHVEMDGAWALHEAWVRLQHGDVDTALVYAFAKSSPGDLPRVLALQLEPYAVGPLWPDAISLAGLQARALLESGDVGPENLAEVVAASRRAAADNPTPCCPVRSTWRSCWPRRPGRTRCAGTTARRHRRGRRGRARDRRPGPGAGGPPRLDPRDRPPRRAAGARPARPHHLGVDTPGGRGRGVGDGPSTSRSSTPPSPTSS
jgi:hypothetical protein